jgi:sensor histidine kinase regulating citrate/malate metabolism
MIIGKYMISPNVEIEKDVPDVFGDIHTINEILSTYFDNSCQAVEANEGAKKIDFKIYKMDGEYVRFEIADNGHGIDEDTQRAIFDVSTSTKGTKGHGFGLVSVRKACSQMKGTKYGFYSAGRGFGSKFWIDVPIATN